MAKKKKLTKAERKEARLRKGKQWLITYTGSPKKMNKHYRERFHVDAVTAAIGVRIPQCFFRMASGKCCSYMSIEFAVRQIISGKDTVADGLFCREIDGLFCRSSPDIIVRRRCVLSHKRRGWLQPSPSFRYSRNLALQDELYHPVINNGPAVLVCVDKRLGTGPVNQSRDAG